MIAGAILVGSALMAVGLFLGLRAQGGGPSSASLAGPASGGETPGGVAALPAPTPPPTPPGPAVLAADDPATATVREEVSRHLTALHKKLAKTCWESLPKDPPPVVPSKYSYSLAFGPDGRLTRQEVNLIRSSGRPDVGDCLAKQRLDLETTPTGRVVNVNVPFEFP